MKINIVKASGLLMSLTMLIIFCLVPVLLTQLEFGSIVYGEKTDLTLILAIASVSCIPFIVSQFWPWQVRVDTSIIGNSRLVNSIMMADMTWSIIFVISGGLTYRSDDTYGLDRGFILSITLRLFPIVTILVLYGLVSASRRRYMSLTAIVLLQIAILLLAGARGYAISLLFIWLAGYLVRLNNLKPGDGPSKTIISGINFLKAKVNRRMLVSFIIMGIVTTLSVTAFILVGTIRAESEAVNVARSTDPVFSTLFRLSEPYWYFSFTHIKQYGSVGYEILERSIENILSIFIRPFGVHYDYSIDGSDYLLEHYLAITKEPGKSLPITFIGEGALFMGLVGSTVYTLIASIMFFASLSIFNIAKYPDKCLKMVFLALLASSAIRLYPLSLSGVFLVSFYETTLNYVVLYFLTSLGYLHGEH